MSHLAHDGGGGRAGRVGLVAVAAGAALCASLLAAGPAAATDGLPSVVLGATATWSYSDDGTDPAGGDADRLVWTYGGYDDSAWKTGAGPFGAKRGSASPDLGAGFPVATVLNQYYDGTTTDIPTEHFRSSFDLTSGQLGELSALAGSVTYDDAVQVFVNGTKVAGFVDDRVEAVPDAQKNLTYAGASNGDPRTSTFTVPSAALVAGTNTIAIALYQDRETSSDLYLSVGDLVPVTGDAGSTAISDLVLNVGSDPTQRNLAWFTSADTAQVAQIAPAAAMTTEDFPEAASTTVTASGGPTASGEQNRFATLTGLAENTVYVYRVGAEGDWSRTYSLRTSTAHGDFDFVFFGDPQIGSSGNIAADAAGWDATLDTAMAAYPGTELLVSLGDQVNSSSNEEQYTGFLSSDVLREVPLATAIGNHDVGSLAYQQHFNLPNVDASAGAASSGTSSGGDYWFVYKDVLFAVLNSNSGDVAAHSAFLTNVVNEHGGDATWKVLALHHPPYSAGPHSDDDDIVYLRSVLPELASSLGFDLVLGGHDHTYARSYLINDGEKANPEEAAGAAAVQAGAGDVLYVTANSASGSKYYTLDASGWWLSAYSQEQKATYGVVEVSDDALTVRTVRAEPTGTEAAGSLVDEVTLTREGEAPDGAAQTVQVAVPQASPGEFAWSIDGGSDLVDMGTATEELDRFTAAGVIKPITVTDTRLGGPQWSISAQVGDFTSGSQSFSGKYLGWTPTVVTEGAGAVAGAPVAPGFGSGYGLSVTSTLGQATTGHARGSGTLGADLELAVPIEVASGTYTAQLTLTALS